MDTNTISTEQLSPQAILRAFDALAGHLRSPLIDLDQADIFRAAGYDWAAGIAVVDALEGGADPWYVLRILGRLVHARAEKEPGDPWAQRAIALLSVAEQLRTGQLDPTADEVNWRILGMIEASRDLPHADEARRLLDAAMDLVHDGSDGSHAEAELERTARELVADVYANVKMGRPQRADEACAAASVLLRDLRAALANAPKRAPDDDEDDDGEEDDDSEETEQVAQANDHAEFLRDSVAYQERMLEHVRAKLRAYEADRGAR